MPTLGELLTEPYLAAELQRLVETGPREWDADAPPPAIAALDLRGAALRVLIHRGLAEVVDDPTLKFYTVVRVKQVPEPPKPAPDLPYAVTPALEALRARRRALGR